MNKIYFILILAKCIIHEPLYAQDIPINKQRQLEDFAEITGVEIHPEDGYLRDLSFFKKHPIALNNATADELQGLQLLTSIQIDNLIRYRSLLGKLVNIYELQAVPGWDIATINNILPYIKLADTASTNEKLFKRFDNGEQYIALEGTRVLERSKGYDTSNPNHFFGDPNHLLLQYNYRNKDLLQMRILGDKDPGEQFFKGAQSHGFDFYSFHLFARKLGIIKTLVIGDYTVNLGQGLMEWQSFSFGKGSDISSVEKQSPILLPYRSAGEFNFNRGMGFTLERGNIEITAFASYKRFSGRIATDSLDFFTSFLNSGLHRTKTEIADRNTIALQSFGGNITYTKESFKIGISAVHNWFSVPFKKRDKPYNYFAFSGKDLLNMGTDYHFNFKNVHAFGELAFDNKFHYAYINGLLISPDAKMDFSVLYRNIQMDYTSLFGSAFTSTTFPVNEKGIYFGLEIKPTGFISINGSADIYYFPWLKYRIDAPSRGNNFSISFHYQKDRAFIFYLSFRNKTKVMNISYPGNALKFPVGEKYKSLQIQAEHQFNSHFIFTNRLELNWQTKRETGFLGYMECKTHFSRKIESSIRLQYFETGKNDIFYTYENVSPNYYNTPSTYDKGVYYYATLTYPLRDRFTLFLKWSQSLYKNKSNIGLGPDLINGNKRSTVNFQVKYEW